MADSGVCECKVVVNVVGGEKAVVNANVSSPAIVNVSNVQMLGIDPSSATAVESDVLDGKTFYAGDNSLRVGTLNENIDIMQAIDLLNINNSGGYEMASDEDYANAEDMFQYWAKIIMFGG